MGQVMAYLNPLNQNDGAGDDGTAKCYGAYMSDSTHQPHKRSRDNPRNNSWNNEKRNETSGYRGRTSWTDRQDCSQIKHNRGYSNKNERLASDFNRQKEYYQRVGSSVEEWSDVNQSQLFNGQVWPPGYRINRENGTVSFPSHSKGRYNKGRANNYAQWDYNQLILGGTSEMNRCTFNNSHSRLHSGRSSNRMNYKDFHNHKGSGSSRNSSKSGNNTEIKDQNICDKDGCASSYVKGDSYGTGDDNVGTSTIVDKLEKEKLNSPAVGGNGSRGRKNTGNIPNHIRHSGNPGKGTGAGKRFDWTNKKQQLKQDDRTSPSNINQRKKKKAKNEPYVIPLPIGLNLDESFDDQAIHMISQFEIAPSDRVKVNQIIDDLVSVYSSRLPNATPILFGSVLAGTAFRNSDIDVSLQCFNMIPDGDVREFIIRHGFLIQKGGLFRHGIRIAHARVPIMKAVHCKTNVSVDVSFQADPLEVQYGYHNSILVKHLCSHDPRVKNLIMLVLFWAKNHGFDSKYQISSFTFILLTIFYLQIVEMLPPLYKIIQINDMDLSWSTSFSTDESLLTNTNTDSLEQLFLGFFTFYSAVHFDEVVISVYAGELVLGALLECRESLPECFNHYRRLVDQNLVEPLTRNKIMCVQEPFNLSWNTVRAASLKTKELFRRSCDSVCQAFSKFSSEKVLSVAMSEYCSGEEVDQDDCYIWQLPCHEKSISPEEWHNRVADAIRTVFSDILLMDVHQGSHEFDDSKFSKFYYSGPMTNPVRFVVSTDYMVTTKTRNKLVQAMNSTSLTEYEKQVKASNLHLEDLQKKCPNKVSKFYAAIYITKNEKNGGVEVLVNRFSKFSNKMKNDHHQFMTYLKKELMNFLGLVLNMKPANTNKENNLCLTTEENKS